MAEKQKLVNPWKRLSRKLIYQNKFGYKILVDQVLTPAKTPGEYLVIENPGYVSVVAITPDDKVILERTWRYPIEEESLEIPAGHLDGKEKPLTAAKRELKEETGVTSTRWHLLGTHWLANGVMKTKGYVFLALDAKVGASPQQETVEEIQTLQMPFDVAIKKVFSNEFQDYRTKLGLLLAKNFLKSTRRA